MLSLVDALALEALDDLARPANARLGRELADNGEVELLDVGARQVEARVGGGRSGSQRRRAALHLSEKQLKWTCTCTSDPQLFCKHLMATALATRALAPTQADPDDEPVPRASGSHRT